MKKFIVFTIVLNFLLFYFFVFADAAFTQALETASDSVYMYSLDAERTVIYEKNADIITNCGSLAKIVTARLVIDACENYDTVISVPAAPIRALDSVSCTRVGILVGEEISVRELLYCMVIANAADAGNVLAYVFGNESIPAFVEQMNTFAAAAGCENTLFTDPNGLDDENQQTTARDIAKIYEACLESEFFTQIVGMDYYEMPATNRYYDIRYLHTTNLTMNSSYYDYYNEYIVTGKAATDDFDKGYVVTTATKDGYKYLCVVLGGSQTDYDEDGKTENMAFVDTAKLYDWLFENVKLRVVARPSTVVAEIQVNYSSEYDYVSLVPMMEVSALVPDGVDADSVYIRAIPEITKTEVDAPVHKGDVLGAASILYAEEEIARVDLVASFDVERSYSKMITQTVKKILIQPVFWIVFLLAGVLFAFCFVRVRIYSARKKLKGGKMRIVKGYEVMDNKKKKK